MNTALAAGEQASDLLIDLKAKALQANQLGLDSVLRAAIETEFNVLCDQLNTVVSQASFGETNLVEAVAQVLEVLSGDDGSTITVQVLTIPPPFCSYQRAAPRSQRHPRTCLW